MGTVPDQPLRRWRRWRLWRAEDASSVFPTDESFEWFMRRHRRELLESDEFILSKGRGGSLVGDGIGAVVLEILRREARQARGEG